MANDLYTNAPTIPHTKIENWTDKCAYSHLYACMNRFPGAATKSLTFLRLETATTNSKVFQDAYKTSTNVSAADKIFW